MKKLLSTTAIIGALALTAGTANAANLQVNVGGFIDFQAGYTSDDVTGEGPTAGATNDANEINFNNDTEVHFTVEGTADNGLEYGAVIELEADVDNSDNAQNGGLNADKAYLFTQGGWGRVEMGANTDAAEALSVNSATFASATGGADGDFYRYIGTPAATSGFVVRPDLPLANAGAGATTGGAFATVDEDATKLTYYTPRVAGFQGGISYIPNVDAVGVTAPSEAGFDNALAAGVNFTTQYDQFAIKLAGAYETAGTKDDTITNGEDISAWELGGNVSFAGFTVGGSYADLGEAITTTNGVVIVDDADYWDAGVGYAFGPWSASASYFTSDVDLVGGGSDEFDNIIVGVDYKLAPGLVPYAEVSFFDFDGDGTGVANDNDGTAVIVGTQLTF